MFYVLRTNNNKLESFWGINAIGAFKTKKDAIAHAKQAIVKENYQTKLIIVKASTIVETTKPEAKEIHL